MGSVFFSDGTSKGRSSLRSSRCSGGGSISSNGRDFSSDSGCTKKVLMNRCNMDCSGSKAYCVGDNSGSSFKSYASNRDGTNTFATSWTLNGGESGTKCSFCGLVATCSMIGDKYQWTTPPEIGAKCK